MTGPLLALDLATHAGWAVGPIPAAREALAIGALSGASGAIVKPLSGHVQFGGPGVDTGMVLGRYRTWLNDTIAFHAPHGIIWEAPLPAGAHGSQQTAVRLIGLSALTEEICAARRIPWRRKANNQKIKKFFAGHGRADKARVKEACAQMGWGEISDDNEADALAVWAFGVSLIYTDAQRRRARLARKLKGI